MAQITIPGYLHVSLGELYFRRFSGANTAFTVSTRPGIKTYTGGTNRLIPVTTPEFSGIVDPNTTKRVELVMEDGTVIDTAKVNAITGEFAFQGWYSDLYTGYRFRFIAPDGREGKSVQVGSPGYNRYAGRPDLVDTSTVRP